MMTHEELSALMDAAEVATPGPWDVHRVEAEDGVRYPTIEADGYDVVTVEGFYGEVDQDVRNAEFMSKANPTTVMNMALELSHLREEVALLRKNDIRYRILRDETQWLDEGPHVVYNTDVGDLPAILSEDELDEKLDAIAKIMEEEGTL